MAEKQVHGKESTCFCQIVDCNIGACAQKKLRFFVFAEKKL